MSAEQISKIQPVRSELSAPYWDGCAVGELRLQQCSQCGEYQFYPRIMCSHCGSKTLNWQRVSGRGSVESFTVVRRGLSDAYSVPYVVALIRLAEGPVMMSQVVNADIEQIAVGAGAQVAFQDWGDGVTAPVFNLLPEV